MRPLRAGGVENLKPVPIDQSMDKATPTARIVLDTSVLITDPNAVHAFAGCEVVLPLTVIEELDGLKSRPDEVGRNARQALREIEDIRNNAGGSLVTAVPTGDHRWLRIALNGVHTNTLEDHGLDVHKADNRIIGAAFGLKEEDDGVAVELYSNDLGLRIKAAHLGLIAKEYRPQQTYDSRGEERSAGWYTLDVAHEVVERLYADHVVPTEEVEGAQGLQLNEFAAIKNGSSSALARQTKAGLQLLRANTPEAWGLRPRSKEQRFALELLMDPEVRVVALDGMAGTGKTILAVAAGLEQVLEQSRYDRFAIYRPIVAVGRQEVGYLPGSLEEKLDPWMAAIHDAIVALTDTRSYSDATELIDQLTDDGTLTLESVTFLRGRSLHKTIVLVDEAQNLEPSVLKTILTRVGEDTKVIFTGDTTQIDAPFLSEQTNAMAVLTAAFAGQELFGHIRLREGQRSAVATLAAELL
jgi:PhoH-like ATPase